jgi:3-hydroxyacyl-CoA dehydrogenase/3a,7a,12a-trihydroxy-5b-cholest-24-enoyl-CoA hydratase
VSQAVAPKADCTLELSDADWLEMTSGKADPQKLFATGKLKISGNVMASQKLEFLKKIDRNSVAAPVAAAPVSGGGATAAHTPMAEKVFAALTERLQKNPQLGKEVDAKLTIKVKNPDFTQTYELGKANTTLTLSDEDLTALAKGQTTVKDLYMHGQLRVDGDLAPLHRLGIFNKLF